MESTPKPRRVRFGPYEADLQEYELRRQGLKVKLNEKPFLVLSLLIEKAGSLVRREELRQRLWPADTYVDFDANLNTALSTLRHTLGDSSENPIFIETVPRQGYRFIAPVVVIEDVQPESATANSPLAATKTPAIEASTQLPSSEKMSRQPPTLWWAAIGIVLIFVAVGFISYSRWNGRSGEAKNRHEIKTILVTPFQNLSGDPGQDYLTDGLTDELITRLGEALPKQLSVIARSTAMQYKNTQKPVEQIAHEQKVDYVLEGCMRRQGDRVRFTAQLFRQGTPGSLWTEGYERNANDLMTIERDVADRIASSLSLSIFPARPNSSSESAEGIDPKAYDDYLKGVYQCRRLYANGAQAPLKFFQQAIDRQPNFARAYAELASCYQKEIRDGFLHPEQAEPPAKAAIQKALQLDNSLAQAHLVLAYLLYQYDWDWDRSENEFHQAINLNPSSEWSHANYAMFLMLRGRFDEALSEAEKAHTLDPMSLEMDSSVSLVYAEARDYDRSIQECRRILEIDPKYISAHYCIGVAEMYQGKYDESLSELKLAEPLGDMTLMAEGTAHAIKGDRQLALRDLEKLKLHAKTMYVSPYGMAEIYNHLGEKEKAYELLDDALRERSDEMIYLRIDPDFDDLRGDPRFNELLTKVGFSTDRVVYPAPQTASPTS
jgi:TolB-like protein/DNA-binding winged helix-turn-helix (wHTH) protein/Tfp pilus assembly protein PilF